MVDPINDFNKLPFPVRKIAVDCELLTRINDLKFLKKRLKENYDREVKWVNERIKSYKSEMSK